MQEYCDNNVPNAGCSCFVSAGLSTAHFPVIKMTTAALSLCKSSHKKKNDLHYVMASITT